MSDLTPLMSRRGGGFARDERFSPPAGEPALPGALGRIGGWNTPARGLNGAHRNPLDGAFNGQEPPVTGLEGTSGWEQQDPAEVLAEMRAEAYAQGMHDAMARAEIETAEAEKQRERFALSFARLNADLAETLRQRLLDTVVSLCESALAPLAVDREALVLRVQRAVAMFSRADDERVIRLNPEDLELVSAQLPGDWTFQPDASLERGALRVETQTGGVEDGPAQWRRSIVEALDLGVMD